jgi:hypothetical protein
MKNSIMRAYRVVSRNALALAIGWLIALAFVQLGQRELGGWPATEVGQLFGSAISVAVALILDARPAAYLWAAMAAFSGSELMVHSHYGIRSAQGAPTHFAVMGASFLAVAFGAWIRRHTGSENLSA